MPTRRVVAVLAGAALAAAALGSPAVSAEPGTAAAGPLVAVTAGDTTADIDIALPLGVGISGRVRSSSGRPIAEASVSVFSATGHRLGRAATEDDGAFRLGPMPAARGYYVCANHHGSAFRSRTATGHLGRCVGSPEYYGGTAPTAGATLFPGRSGTVVRGLDVRLPPGAAVSGRLQDAASGDALGGLTIEVLDGAGRRVRVGAVDGDYQVSGLPTGEYRICARANTASTGGVYDSVTDIRGTGYAEHCARPVRLVAGSHRSGVNLHLPRAAAVRGTVLADDDLGVRNSVVRVFRNHDLVTAARTGRGGGFDITGLRAGRYQVCAHAGRAGRSPVRYDLPRCAPVSLVAGRTETGLTLRPQYSAQQFGVLAGTVRNQDGTALRGIPVDVYDGHGRHQVTTETTAGGDYVVRGLPIGAYQVCFDRSAGGTPGRYAPVCGGDAPWNQADLPGDAAWVFVSPGATAPRFDATLPPAGTVTGTVTAAGQPLAGQTVWLLSASGNVIDWRWTGRTGRYRFGGLAAVPRGYGVCVSAPDVDGNTDTVPDLAPATGLRSQCYDEVRWRRPLAAVPH